MKDIVADCFQPACVFDALVGDSMLPLYPEHQFWILFYSKFLHLSILLGLSLFVNYSNFFWDLVGFFFFLGGGWGGGLLHPSRGSLIQLSPLEDHCSTFVSRVLVLNKETNTIKQDNTMRTIPFRWKKTSTSTILGCGDLLISSYQLHWLASMVHIDFALVHNCFSLFIDNDNLGIYEPRIGELVRDPYQSSIGIVWYSPYHTILGSILSPMKLRKIPKSLPFPW